MSEWFELKSVFEKKKRDLYTNRTTYLFEFYEYTRTTT